MRSSTTTTSPTRYRRMSVASAMSRRPELGSISEGTALAVGVGSRQVDPQADLGLLISVS